MAQEYRDVTLGWCSVGAWVVGAWEVGAWVVDGAAGATLQRR